MPEPHSQPQSPNTTATIYQLTQQLAKKALPSLEAIKAASTPYVKATNALICYISDLDIATAAVLAISFAGQLRG